MMSEAIDGVVLLVCDVHDGSDGTDASKSLI